MEMSSHTKFSDMSYREISSMAKSYKIPGNLKKITLIKAIIAYEEHRLDDVEKIISECRMQRKRKTLDAAESKEIKCTSVGRKKRICSTPANMGYIAPTCVGKKRICSTPANMGYIAPTCVGSNLDVELIPVEHTTRPLHQENFEQTSPVLMNHSITACERRIQALVLSQCPSAESSYIYMDSHYQSSGSIVPMLNAHGLHRSQGHHLCCREMSHEYPDDVPKILPRKPIPSYNPPSYHSNWPLPMYNQFASASSTSCYPSLPANKFVNGSSTSQFSPLPPLIPFNSRNCYTEPPISDFSPPVGSSHSIYSPNYYNANIAPNFGFSQSIDRATSPGCNSICCSQMVPNSNYVPLPSTSVATLGIQNISSFNSSNLIPTSSYIPTSSGPENIFNPNSSKFPDYSNLDLACYNQKYSMSLYNEKNINCPQTTTASSSPAELTDLSVELNCSPYLLPDIPELTDLPIQCRNNMVLSDDDITTDIFSVSSISGSPATRKKRVIEVIENNWSSELAVFHLENDLTITVDQIVNLVDGAVTEDVASESNNFSHAIESINSTNRNVDRERCCYNYWGCPEKFSLNVHEPLCCYQPVFCPVNGCIWKKSAAVRLLTHIHESHGDSVLSTNNFIHKFRIESLRKKGSLTYFHYYKSMMYIVRVEILRKDIIATFQHIPTLIQNYYEKTTVYGTLECNLELENGNLELENDHQFWSGRVLPYYGLPLEYDNIANRALYIKNPQSKYITLSAKIYSKNYSIKCETMDSDG